VRIRIALGTAVAVIVLPALLFALFSIPAASARVTRHEAISQHRAVRIDSKLMSYAQAEKVAQLATYANAVAAQQEATYLKDVAFMKALKDAAFIKALQQQSAQRAAAAANQAQAAAAARAQAATAAAPAPAAPAAAPAPAGAVSDATSTNTPDWACIRQHESGGDYGAGNGGAYQFENGTWTGVTGLPGPAQSYPAATQDAAALRLFAQRGWAPWTTRYVCGL
jgi:nitrogen fixation/metabolism regulation signal transduction histidine kinase